MSNYDNEKILFTGLAGRSSSEIRGKQIASMDKNFFYCDQERLTQGVLDQCDTVVFVRNFVEGIARHAKQCGKKVAFDIIDRPTADIHKLYRSGHKNPEVDWESYCKLSVDYLIVNNTLTKKCLQDQPGCPTIKVIPHHTCNIEKHRNEVKEEVTTVGYVGLDDQISKTDMIKSWLNDKNIELLIVNPKDRQSVIAAHKKIDVGLIFLEAPTKYYTSVLDFKPCTKMINFQSFGIPVVSCQYESFKEFGSDAYLPVSNVEEVFVHLEKLISDKSERDRLSSLGIENSSNYSIQKIAELYK